MSYTCNNYNPTYRVPSCRLFAFCFSPLVVLNLNGTCRSGWPACQVWRWVLWSNQVYGSRHGRCSFGWAGWQEGSGSKKSIRGQWTGQGGYLCFLFWDIVKPKLPNLAAHAPASRTSSTWSASRIPSWDWPPSWKACARTFSPTTRQTLRNSRSPI